jgi:hypothetical protein
MAGYLRLQEDGDEITVTAGGTITGGQLVTVSAANTVITATAAGAKILGVAAYDAVSGDLLTVVRNGIHQTLASGTVTAGDNVEAAAAGAVATHTNGTADVNIVGMALTTATTGNPVNWVWNR